MFKERNLKKNLKNPKKNPKREKKVIYSFHQFFVGDFTDFLLKKRENESSKWTVFSPGVTRFSFSLLSPDVTRFLTEHRNMPMEDAIAFVGKSFDTYISILKGKCDWGLREAISPIFGLEVYQVDMI